MRYGHEKCENCKNTFSPRDNPTPEDKPWQEYICPDCREYADAKAEDDELA